jgi:hypothetical protein
MLLFLRLLDLQNAIQLMYLAIEIVVGLKQLHHHLVVVYLQLRDILIFLMLFGKQECIPQSDAYM